MPLFEISFNSFILSFVNRSALVFALQPLELLQPLDLEREDSKEEENEEEITLSVAAEARPEPTHEQSPSNVVARLLSELEPQKEVAESNLGPRANPSRLEVLHSDEIKRGTPSRHSNRATFRQIIEEVARSSILHQK